MNKKDAITKARAGINVGDLREILNNAVDDLHGMSKVNKCFTRRAVWDIMHGSIGNYPASVTVDPSIAVNILREFAQDEPKEVKQFCDVNSVPF